MKGCPRPAVTNLDGGEEDGVEVHIVLAHELVQADVLVIEPPLFPLRCIVGCYTDVPNARLELQRTWSAQIGVWQLSNVPKHLRYIIFSDLSLHYTVELLTEHLSSHGLIIFCSHRDRDSPREISRHRTRPHPLLQPGIHDLSFSVDNRIRRPLPVLPRLFDPFFRQRLNGVEFEVHVGGDAGDDGVGFVDKTSGVDEFCGVKRACARVALIATSILRMTSGKGTWLGFGESEN